VFTDRRLGCQFAVEIAANTRTQWGEVMTTHRQGTWTRTLVWSLVLAGSPPFAAIAQEPVIKPTNPAAGTVARLPSPGIVTASQLPDGRIRVTWSRVPDATSYAIIRSVPPEVATPITPNVIDTVFIDSDVMIGRTYYYVVSGLNDLTTGLKRGAAPVTATRNVGPVVELKPPTNVSARYEADRKMVIVTWQGPSGLTYLIESRTLPSDTWTLVGRGNALSAGIVRLSEGARMHFRVMSQDAYGMRSSAAGSNEVLIPSSGGLPGAGGATQATGTVAVSMGAMLPLRVGGVTSAASAVTGFTASRWISLDEGIATVEGSGTVTARATGRAQILAIGRAADGSVRVTLVQVTVSP
jgi:hypothetical protein